MKKIFVSLTGLTFLLIAFVVFAYALGTPADTPGQVSAEQQKFLRETKDLRKERHDLRCQLMEASQTANPDAQKIAGLKKQITVLRQEIQAKAKELGVSAGPKNCANGNCGQERPLNCPGVVQRGTTQ